jgi:maltose O-acetyltransferase
VIAVARSELWEFLVQLRSEPRRALLKLDHAFGVMRAHVLFAGCELGRRVVASGDVKVRNDGRLTIGDRVIFVGGMIPSEVTCEAGASIQMGEGSLLNYGSVLHAKQEVRIGRRCMLASMVRVVDHDPARTAPIVIGDDVWVAHGAVIGPGVTIGDGAVVSAGSVVTQDVPAHSMAMGNPARAMSLSLVAPE